MPFSGTVPLVLFIAKATLLLLAALVATAALRRSTAGARHLVWLAALVGVLALPVLSRVPSLHLEILPSSLGAALDAPDAAPAMPEVAVQPARAVRPARPERPALPAVAPAAPSAPIARIVVPRSVSLPGEPADLIPAAASLVNGWGYSILTTAV